VAGADGNNFLPTKPVTREELAVMLSNCAKASGRAMLGAAPAQDFSDSWQISPWAREGVEAVRRAGIVNGREGNRFEPRGLATRAEVAAMLRRYMEFMDK
jgi:hypothetical protein